QDSAQPLRNSSAGSPVRVSRLSAGLVMTMGTGQKSAAIRLAVLGGGAVIIDTLAKDVVVGLYPLSVFGRLQQETKQIQQGRRIRSLRIQRIQERALRVWGGDPRASPSLV